MIDYWKKKYDHLARRVLWFCAVVDDGQTPELAIESYFASRRELASGAESDLAALRAKVEALAGEFSAKALHGTRAQAGSVPPLHPAYKRAMTECALALRSLLPGGDDGKEAR